MPTLVAGARRGAFTGITSNSPEIDDHLVRKRSPVRIRARAPYGLRPQFRASCARRALDLHPNRSFCAKRAESASWLSHRGAAAARRSSRPRRYWRRRRIVLRSQRRAISACASIFRCMGTAALRSVLRRSLPDRLAVDRRSSIVASFWPSIAPVVVLVIEATELGQTHVQVASEERTSSSSEFSPNL